MLLVHATSFARTQIFSLRGLLWSCYFIMLLDHIAWSWYLIMLLQFPNLFMLHSVGLAFANVRYQPSDVTLRKRCERMMLVLSTFVPTHTSIELYAPQHDPGTGYLIMLLHHATWSYCLIMVFDHVTSVSKLIYVTCCWSGLRKACVTSLRMQHLSRGAVRYSNLIRFLVIISEAFLVCMGHNMIQEQVYM